MRSRAEEPDRRSREQRRKNKLRRILTTESIDRVGDQDLASGVGPTFGSSCEPVRHFKKPNTRNKAEIKGITDKAKNKCITESIHCVQIRLRSRLQSQLGRRRKDLGRRIDMGRAHRRSSDKVVSTDKTQSRPRIYPRRTNCAGETRQKAEGNPEQAAPSPTTLEGLRSTSQPPWKTIAVGGDSVLTSAQRSAEEWIQWNTPQQSASSTSAWTWQSWQWRE